MHPTQPAIAREKFFFYEKNTGVSHFHVEADDTGPFPCRTSRLFAGHALHGAQLRSRKTTW
jgi:hypothetical protein